MSNTDWKQKALLPKLLTKEDAAYHAVEDLQHALEDDNICNNIIQQKSRFCKRLLRCGRD